MDASLEAQIKAMRLEGVSIKNIRKRLRVGQKTVEAVVRTMSQQTIRARARRADLEPKIRQGLDAGMTRAAVAAFSGCSPTLVCRVMRDLGLWKHRATTEPRERTQSEITAELIQADQRWRSVAHGLRYENFVEPPFRPVRFARPGEVPISCTAAMVADS